MPFFDFLRNLFRRRSPDEPNLSEGSEEVSNLQISVVSSCISSVSYDFGSEELTITFTDGSRYVYENVDTGTYAGLFSAGSKGAYFNSFIRNSFPFRRI